MGDKRPERVFVDITEKFMLIADEIVSQYILQDIRTKPSRVNSNATAYAKAIRKNNKEHRIHMKEANKVKAERRSREGRAPIDDRPMTYGEYAHTKMPQYTAEKHESMYKAAKVGLAKWKSEHKGLKAHESKDPTVQGMLTIERLRFAYEDSPHKR
jgi:hypothetical protein